MLETMRMLACAALVAGLAFAQDPNPERLFQSAVAAQQRGDFSAAIREYQQILKVQPDSVKARMNLGAALAHLGRFDEAIADYGLALKRDPANGQIRMNLALAYYKKGDLEAAAREFQVLRKAAPGDARIATLLGDCDLRLARGEQAIAVLVPLEGAHASDLDLLYVLGSAMIKAGKASEGLSLIERVAKQGNSADAYMLAGATQLKLTNYDRARENLDAALRLNPHLPGVYTLIGTVADKTGDEAGAEVAFRKALDANRDDFESNLYIGAVLYQKRDIEGAKRYLERATELNSASSMARDEKALVKRAEGQLDSAASDLEKVVHDDPAWLQPHVELAALYFRLHRQADGIKQRQIVDKLSAEQQKQGPDAAAGR